MMNRREINSALAVVFTALFSGSASGLMQEPASPAGKATPGPKPYKSTAVVTTLMQEPLEAIPNPEATVITLTIPPGSVSQPHEHIGPVFAYILEGEIENQVDPNPPQRYQAGQFFYEPRMHVHRSLRNLSKTQTAKILVFEVGEHGKPFTISAS
jgi:quercetin dioxygenase-like cupin family protein